MDKNENAKTKTNNQIVSQMSDVSLKHENKKVLLSSTIFLGFNLALEAITSSGVSGKTKSG